MGEWRDGGWGDEGMAGWGDGLEGVACGYFVGLLDIHQEDLELKAEGGLIFLGHKKVQFYSSELVFHVVPCAPISSTAFHSASLSPLPPCPVIHSVVPSMQANYWLWNKPPSCSSRRTRSPAASHCRPCDEQAH